MKKLDMTDYTMRDTADLIRNHVEGLLKGEDHMPCIEEQLAKLRTQIDNHVGSVWLMSIREYQNILDHLGLTHEDVVKQGVTWKDLVNGFTEEELKQLAE